MSKISIIIPIYKVPEFFLRRNIEKCINQTFKDIEIILINDGSPDNCGSICDEYAKKDKRIKVVHQKNKGLCGARNTGVKNATGEYIMFIDGDDYIELFACEDLYNNSNVTKPDVVLAEMCKNYGKSVKKYNYGNFKANKLYINRDIDYLQKQVLNFNGNISSVNGKLIKRKFLLENNIFHDENLRQGAEGIEFFIRLFGKAKTVLFLNKCIYHYCYNSKSITEKHNEKNHKMVLACFKKIKTEINNNDSEIMFWFYDRMQYVVLTTAISGYFSPSNKEPYKQQKQKFKKYLNNNLIQETFKNTKINNIDFVRKITFYCIKYHLYFIVKIIALLRYYQKRREKL